MNKRLDKAFVAIMSVLFTVLAATSCGGGEIYDTYRHTPLNGWDRTDTLYYDVPPVESAGIYRQELGLRIDDDFPFTGLTLVVDRTIEPGHRVSSDTLRCRLSDDKGNSYGQGVSYYQYDFAVAEYSLNKGDSLHIGVRHIMKREMLPGISDIGLRLIKKK